MYRKLYHNRFY